MTALLIIGGILGILFIAMMLMGRSQSKFMNEYYSMSPDKRKREMERLEDKLYNHFISIGEYEAAQKVLNKEYEYRHLKGFEKYYKI